MFLLKLLLLIATSTVATEALKCYKCGDSTPCPEPFDSTKVAKPTCPGVNQDVCTGRKFTCILFNLAPLSTTFHSLKLYFFFTQISMKMVV